MKAIVLAARGLQLGALGCYGNQWIETPALDALAAAGIVFDQHFADDADPIRVRRAWRSGRYHLPAPIAIAEKTAGSDLLTVLRERGIHTCLIVDDSRSSPDDEFALDWDEVERIAPDDDASPLEATLEAVGAVLERMEHRDDWLLWIEFASLVPPWEVPEEFQAPYFQEEPPEDDEEEESPEMERLTPLTEVPAGAIDPDDDTLFLSLQASYAAAVSHLDSGLGALLQALDGLDGGDDVLLIFTTDVGPDLGEHCATAPIQSRLHDAVIHLPLLLRLPAGAEAGRRVSALTQAVDLAATLADFFQTPLLDAHGRSLLPLARGEVESIRPYACAGLQIGEEIAYALRTPEWAFLLPAHTNAEGAIPSPKLYVKPDDRAEVNDVSQHHPDLVERFERTLRDFVTASCQLGSLQAPPLPEAEDSPDASLANPVSE